MHCREPISDDFIIDNTGLSWRLSKYKIYKEQILYDSEKAQLPATQVYAEAYQTAKKVLEPIKTEKGPLSATYMKSKMLVKSIDYSRHETEVSRFHNYLVENIPNYSSLSKKEIAKIRQENANLRSKCKVRLLEMIAIERLYDPIISTYGKAIDNLNEQQLRVKRVMMKACPKTGCNAFLNEEFSCGLCATSVCKKCHEIKLDDQDHECNEETIESIKAIHSEARSCPTCATLISKIDGCDQMWCTQCKTTFSWRTGLVEQGITHNPHYYEWMRRNGGLPRAPGDNPGGCNAFPGLGDLINSKPHILQAVQKGRKHSRELKDTVIDDPEFLSYLIITEYHRILQHAQAYNRRPIPRPDNFELRVKFLTNEIDEKTFKVKLQRIDKGYRKSVAKKHIYDMTYAAAGDILINTLSGTSFIDTKVQIDTLFTYSNKALERIEKGYSCVAEKYLIMDIGEEELKKHSIWFNPHYYY